MAKTKTKAFRKKESKPKSAPIQAEQPKKDKIVLTPETTAVVSVYCEGAFKTRKSNAGTKEQKRKMMLSPLLMENKEGKFTRQRLTKFTDWFSTDGWRKLATGEKIKNYYEGPKTYEEYESHECSMSIPLNAEQLKGFYSEDGRPYFIKADEWKMKSRIARININVGILIADRFPGKTPQFEVSYLN